MIINDIKIKRRRQKLQRGRGIGSGRGAKSGRGQKGQKSRSGGRQRLGFEGEQTSLVERIPKLRGMGYKNPRRRTARFFAEEVSLDRLVKHFKDGELVTPKALCQRGLIKTSRGGAKIIGGGKVKTLRFRNVAVSETARAAITKAGGQVESVGQSKAAEKPAKSSVKAPKTKA